MYYPTSARHQCSQRAHLLLTTNTRLLQKCYQMSLIHILLDKYCNFTWLLLICVWFMHNVVTMKSNRMPHSDITCMHNGQSLAFASPSVIYRICICYHVTVILAQDCIVQRIVFDFPVLYLYFIFILRQKYCYF